MIITSSRNDKFEKLSKKRRLKINAKTDTENVSENEAKMDEKSSKIESKILLFCERVVFRKVWFSFKKKHTFRGSGRPKSDAASKKINAESVLEKRIQRWSKMMPKLNQHASKNYKNDDQKSIRKSMRKSMQNRCKTAPSKWGSAAEALAPY